ncbi:uncharacterized protein LY89DRAFT_783009 [Mollisia scopiformis]|uniref:Serine aminopeptidase S33 domain-containing protein n=1 Tax=Mollisia scopiformis TaxID=149040 RepID=A0A194X6D4_MOLSC|nr:uncharacterized protein LY89DRAFT_783009 [Mollisia scopiformis]KUJ15735.1 hypothetical protein LY89DRAFT_783009 [Mollisia scopiformis]
MKSSHLQLSSLLFSVFASAQNSRICQDYMIPVNITSQVLVASYPHFQDSYDVVDFINNLARRDANATKSPFSGVESATAAYNIGATFCSPGTNTNTSQERTILVATHGLAYDRRYWDSGMDPTNYSFVDFAISRGYSVFFYDRLGTGLSSKVSGYNESQATTQLGILQQLTGFLRDGKYTGNFGTPSKIVHVGHSFGSLLSNGLIATTPEISDGAILTGLAYDQNASPFLEAFALRIASEQFPGKWSDRDNHYVTSVDAAANAATFFHGDSFSKEVLWYTESITQPVASIELLTSGAIRLNATTFTKPVMIISGEFDFAVCGGNCVGILEHPAKEVNFPNATDFQAIVHPSTGHNINFSYNATGAYDVILSYLSKHGL